MIKSLAVASLFAAAVMAQTSPSNALIPTGISASCSTFLQGLDSDTSFSCLTNLVSVLSAFAPGQSASSSNTSLTTSLNTLCSSDGCDESMYRSKLAAFQAACPDELMTTPNNDVVKIYDSIYTLKPLHDAVCLKDDSGRYCVANPSTSSSNGTTNATSTATISPRSTGSSPSAAEILRRDANDTQTYSPNESTWTQQNIAFLLLQPSLSVTALCTTCTRGILGAWIQFESDAPYAPGLQQSVLLSGQNALYNAVQSKCGNSFLSGAVQAAGGISNGGPFGGSSTSSARSNSGEMLTSVAVILASFAVGSAAML